MSGGDINGLTHAEQPRRRAQKHRCELRSDRFREADATLRSAVTVTVPDQAVGLRTKRLSHHRMVHGNVWDGCKLVRRSYYGRIHGFPPLSALRRGVEM
jgi:hypothetical protein